MYLAYTVIPHYSSLACILSKSTTPNELPGTNTRYLQVFDYIAKSRIKDALDTLGMLCNQSRNRDLTAARESRGNLFKHAEICI